MTKEEMLSSIYDEMADKTLSDGCTVRNSDWRMRTTWTAGINSNTIYFGWCWCCEEYDEEWEYTIIWHPVRIGDVLKYIDTNYCFIDDGEWHKSRDMKALNHMLHSLFYNFVGKQDRPIDEQSDELAIEFVYNLIKK